MKKTAPSCGAPPHPAQAAREPGACAAPAGIGGRHGLRAGDPPSSGIGATPRRFVGLRCHGGRCYDAGSNRFESRPMNQPLHHHDHTAACGAPCAGAAWVDSGIAPGLVVVDSNRPAYSAGAARGLLKQFGAAH